MTKLMIIAGLVFSLGACKDDFDKALGEASSLTDKMCECKTKDCAEKVRDQRREVKKRFKASLGDKKPSESQMKKADDIDQRWRTCADKAEGNG